MYEMTTELASFPRPQGHQLLLFEALARRPEEVDRFLGVLGGVVPIPSRPRRSRSPSTSRRWTRRVGWDA
jgi:hypothetical protein